MNSWSLPTVCEPTTIALVSAGASALGSVAGYMGQQQAADAQDAAYDQNVKNSIVAMQGDIEANNLNAMSADEAATQRRFEAQQEGLAARGAARASAAERGIGGFTAAALEQDIAMQQGRNIAAINRNQELDAQRTRLSNRAATDTAQSRINSMQRGQRPSGLGLIAGLAGAAAGGFSTRQSLLHMRAQRAAMTPKGP